MQTAVVKLYGKQTAAHMFVLEIITKRYYWFIRCHTFHVDYQIYFRFVLLWTVTLLGFKKNANTSDSYPLLAAIIKYVQMLSNLFNKLTEQKWSICSVESINTISRAKKNLFYITHMITALQRTNYLQLNVSFIERMASHRTFSHCETVRRIH